jgi:NAD(P)-dependent dehydrogenase (short-subunit alcohol dehydrogenase family)
MFLVTGMKALFTGKVVLITGGTSGIGRATAVTFAAQGASVVVAGRREQEGEESVRLVEQAGGKGLFIRTDVQFEKEIADLVAGTVKHFGRLDFAFNNAGIGGEGRADFNSTGEVFDRIMAINARSVFFSLKHEIPAILEAGGGAIVNNASILGLRPNPSSPIYSASKATVISLTQSAALEFAGKGIRVNAVCAAIIETDMTKRIRSDDQNRNWLLERHPIGRFGRPEEVAAAILYLCSPESAFVTGVALPIAGGFGL